MGSLFAVATVGFSREVVTVLWIGTAVVKMSQAPSSLVEKLVFDKLYYLWGNDKFLIISGCELHYKGACAYFL